MKIDLVSSGWASADAGPHLLFVPALDGTFGGLAHDVYYSAKLNRLDYRVGPTKSPSKATVAEIAAIGAWASSLAKDGKGGRLLVTFGGKSFHVRFAEFADSIVFRIISADPGLRELGLPNNVLDWFRAIIGQERGLIFVSGGTGSGKTTTMLHLVKLCSETQDPRYEQPNVYKSVISIEDPIEYRLNNNWVAQIQVDRERGATFENLLMSSLRHAPDVIALGELRDTRALKTAIDVSTSHLVIAAAHHKIIPPHSVQDVASAIIEVDMCMGHFSLAPLFNIRAVTNHGVQCWTWEDSVGQQTRLGTISESQGMEFMKTKDFGLPRSLRERLDAATHMVTKNSFVFKNRDAFRDYYNRGLPVSEIQAIVQDELKVDLSAETFKQWLTTEGLSAQRPKM